MVTLAIQIIYCWCFLMCCLETHLSTTHHCPVHWISNFTSWNPIHYLLNQRLSQSPCLSLCFQIFTHSGTVPLNIISPVPLPDGLPSKEKRKYLPQIEVLTGTLPSISFACFMILKCYFLCFKNRVHPQSKTLKFATYSFTL